MMSETRTEPSAEGDEEEYRAIEAAVGQTARGRWFLLEHARRHRGADTDVILAAIEQLGSRLSGDAAPLPVPASAPPAEAAPPGNDVLRKAAQQLEAVKASLSAMAAAITRDAAEASAIKHPAKGTGSFQDLDGLEAVADDIEAANSAVLDAAEHIQEIAWTMRERGAEGAACDRLDQRASDIYAACAGEDAATRRLRVFLHSTRLIGRHLAALNEAFQIPGPEAAEPDARAETPPQSLSATVPAARAPASGDLDDLDFVLAPDPGPRPGKAAANGAAKPVAQPDEAERRRQEQLAILAEIDGLALHDKLKLFT